MDTDCIKNRVVAIGVAALLAAQPVPAFAAAGSSAQQGAETQQSVSGGTEDESVQEVALDSFGVDSDAEGGAVEAAAARGDNGEIAIGDLELRDGQTVTLCYDDQGSFDRESTERAIIESIVAATPSGTADDAKIEYYAGKALSGFKNVEQWLSIDKAPSWNFTDKHTFGEGVQKIRVTCGGQSAIVEATFRGLSDSGLSLIEGVSELPLSYADGSAIDADATVATILDQAVAGWGLCDKAEAKVEYCYNHINYTSLDYKPSSLSIGHKAFGAGEQWIRVSVPANEKHRAFSQEFKLTFKDARPTPSFAFVEHPEALLSFKDDGTVDLDATLSALKDSGILAATTGCDASEISLEASVDGAGDHDVIFSVPATASHKGFSQTVKVSFVDARGASDITINDGQNVDLVYRANGEVDEEATKAAVRTAVLGENAAEDVVLDFSGSLLPGSLEVRVSAPATKDHKGVDATVNVVLKDARVQPTISFKQESPWKAVFKDGKLDPSGTESYVRDELLDGGALAGVDKPEVKLEYCYFNLFGQSQKWASFSYSPTNVNLGGTGWVSFGVDKDLIIRATVPATDKHAGAVVTKTVRFEDQRQEAKLVFNENATIAYTSDVDQMKAQVLSQIDKDASSIPADLDASEFTFEYYAPMYLFGSQSDLNIIKGWAPLEGSRDSIREYPRMGAGDQQIRVKFNGNGEYKPTEAVESNLKVNKGKLKIKVKNGSIYAGEKDSAAKIHALTTLDSTDDIDLYRVYAGLTSTASGKIYLELPGSITDSRVLKVLDPISQKTLGAPLTEVLKDGKVSFGQVRSFIQGVTDSPEVNWLANFGIIDKDALTALNKTLSALKFADGAEIDFGVPRVAGLFTTYVVSDNTNYETAVSAGELLVKFNAKGTALVWILNGSEGEKSGTFTVSDIQQNPDWYKATLTCDGDGTIDQSNVRYHFTGFTKKGRLFSGSKAPTEAGYYLQTVSTYGGSYFAWAKTRAFTITK